MQFDISIRASQGARRNQEDCALAWPGPPVDDAPDRDSASLLVLPVADPGHAAAVLCDGMGGHAGGAMASRLACEAFLPAVTGGDSDVRQGLFKALELANSAIAEKAAQTASFRGMGSTLVGVHLGPAGLAWISVGDSLLFLCRAGRIMRLNADHSLAPEIDKLAESGKITWAQAEADPRRHYLRSAMTGDEIEMIDLSESAAPLLAGDVVLLASDGIHTLDTDAIAGIVADRAHAGADAIAQRLISAVDAVRQRHQDNTTVIVMCVRSNATVRDDTPRSRDDAELGDV